MWAFVVMALLLVILIVIVARLIGPDVVEKLLMIVVILVLSPVFFVLACLLAKSTGGMMPDYSNGVREGCITKISKKGFFWKTWEAEMQVGSGEPSSSIQGPFAFSVDGSKHADWSADWIKQNLGKRVTVEYREWALMPYSVGESGYQATELTLHPADKK